MLAVHASAQTSPPPAFDPVIALEQAVQLADFQNDPAGAKAFLEKLTGPEIPAKIREQAVARLAKLNVSTNPVTESKSSPEGIKNQSAASPNAAPIAPVMSAMERLEEAMSLLMKDGAKDRSALVDAAIDGMAKSTGKGAEFISLEEVQKGQGMINANTAGIGAVMGEDKDGAFIWEALPGSPAEYAGIQPKTHILEVDGKTQFALGGDLLDVNGALRGLEGTRVKLKLKEPSGEVREVELRRAKFDDSGHMCEQMTSGLLPADVLGITIKRFGGKTRDEVTAILDQEGFRKKLPRGLIIDLRGNSGPQFTGGEGVASRFLNKGLIATYKRGGRFISVGASPEDAKFAGVPIAVLVDERTSASAELMAATLQDHRRAAIIGRRTAGVSSLYETQPLKGGGYLKHPVLWFARPSGANLERNPHMTDTDTWGVVPDIEVAAAPRKPLKPGQLTKPEDEDLNLMIKAALAHFDSLDAKE
jgi:carboxyl-terminal processing protease